MPTLTPSRPAPAVSRDTLDSTRVAVRELLARSPAYAQLAPETQRQMAHDIVQVGSYMAEPGMKVSPGQAAPQVQALAGNGLFGLPGLGSANQAQASGSTKVQQVSESGAPKFGQAAAAGVDQAIRLIQGVNFPGFVSGLINGVFHSIVTSSIEQMEAYAKLVADVSKSIDQFRDDNTTSNQGRDHLLDEFGDLFKLQGPGEGDFDFGDGGGGAAKGPRVVLRDDVDESAAVQRINASGLPLSKPLTGLDNDVIEALLVPAARTTIATGRQQLLATMVMMGINRIVVTDGKIQAKVMFDFQAKDTRKFAKSAVSYDYATDAYGNVQQSASSSGDYDNKYDGGSTTYDSGNPTQVTGAQSYSKGTYKYDQTPIVTLMSTSQLRDDSSLQTKATLSGLVEVNFKSDYLPLDKMADPAAIAAIQMNAQPGMVKSVAGKVGGGRGTGGAPAAAPAPAPAAAPAAATAP